jgi:hypothetical protein
VVVVGVLDQATKEALQEVLVVEETDVLVVVAL